MLEGILSNRVSIAYIEENRNDCTLYRHSVRDSIFSFRMRTASGRSDNPSSESDEKSRSILRITLSAFSREFAVGGILKISADLISLIQPQLLK